MKRNLSKRVITVATAAAMAFSILAAFIPDKTVFASENLLINGDAKEGNLSGWTESSGNAAASVWDACKESGNPGDKGPYEGDYQFVPYWATGAGETTTMLYQDVDAKDFYPGDVFEASAYMHTNGEGDLARLYLEFVGPDGDVMYRDDGKSEAYWADEWGSEWVRKSVSASMPVGTDKVRVIIRAYNKDGGTLANAFFDNVTLVNLGQ